MLKTETIKGDAVEALLNNQISLLLHVTNDQGVMGAGIAAQIKYLIPEAFSVYKQNHTLGQTSFSKNPDQLGIVANLTAQSFYGPSHKNNHRYLNYGALSVCLQQVLLFLNSMNNIHNQNRSSSETKTIKVGLPKKMGAFRAGGDWDIVLEMVEFIIGRQYQIIVYDFDMG